MISFALGFQAASAAICCCAPLIAATRCSGIADADEAEDGTQIGFAMLERGRRRTFAVETAARDGENHPLVTGEALGTIGAVPKGLAGDEDTIDPRLELARHREIVESDADDDGVGGEEFTQHFAARRKIIADGGLVRPIGILRRRDIATRKVRHRRFAEIAVRDRRARRGGGEARDDIGGKLAADRVGAEDAGIDMEDIHRRGSLV